MAFIEVDHGKATAERFEASFLNGDFRNLNEIEANKIYNSIGQVHVNEVLKKSVQEVVVTYIHELVAYL